MNFCDLAVSGVADLRPYQPGKPIEELQRQHGIRDVIKLASNENPLGPSKAALAAIALNSRELSRYPDGNGFSLKTALAEKFQLQTKQITLGNGSNDILEMIARCFVSPQDEVIVSEHAFAIYALVAQAIGATSVVTPALNYGHDLQAMLAAVTERTKLIFIANPNNPTGTLLSAAELHQFLQQLPAHVLVVLDEAYVEYNNESSKSFDWLVQFSNLIVTRTFSKAYGLAGLRVGFAVSDPAITDLLNRVRQPFNVNNLALAAAVASLNDEDYLIESRAVNVAGMQQYEQGFKQLGLKWIPSSGNFITVDVGRSAADVYEALLQRGVIVRPIAAYGLPKHLRISIGLEADNARCLKALAEVLES